MNKLVKTTLAASIALALTACHNDKKETPPPPPPEPTTLDIAGGAVKGSLAFATVNVYAASDTEKAILLATTQTLENGDYSVQIVDESGAAIMGTFLIEVVADEDTTMICDASVCGDLVYGDTIPFGELLGLTLSTISYTDGSAIDADVNSLTTMATDTILSAAAIEGTGLDLATISAEDFLAVQQDSSEIVGALLGVDLSATNLFTIDIVDAFNADTVSTTDSIVATLTLINASLTSLTVTDGSTLADEIVGYLDAIEEITAVLLADPEADLGSGETAAALATVNATQEQISQEIVNIAVAVDLKSEGDPLPPLEEVPTEVDEDALGDIIGDIIDGTGGTGGTGGEG
ncbi:hypothetical protein [Colwellia piezophila]|uniref:hypothetical protein n=1 Tax=Colwellia piezophila TaxID=211668 RepID=UPI0003734201|nr:hypothetical protein [Colwellia piezophila]